MSNPMQLALARLLTQTVLNDEEGRALMEVRGARETVGRGVEYVRREQEVNSTCLLVEGIVARSVMAKNGSRQITAFYVAGDIPDLYSLMQPKVSSSLRAATDCQILRIPHAALRKIAGEFPGIMEAILRYTVFDASVATEWIANVGMRPGVQRIAHLLCEMAVKTGRISDAPF